MHTFEFTDEEVIELSRSLIGRLDLELTPKIKQAGTRGDIASLRNLVRVYEANKSVLDKLLPAYTDLTSKI